VRNDREVSNNFWGNCPRNFKSKNVTYPARISTIHLFAPCLWNLQIVSGITSSTLFWYQLLHFRLTYYFTHHFFLFWFTTLLCSSITPSLVHFRLKICLFLKSYPSSLTFFLLDCLYGLLPGPFLLSYSVSVFSFSQFFFSCARLSCPSRHLLSARKYTVPSHHIVLTKENAELSTCR